MDDYFFQYIKEKKNQTEKEYLESIKVPSTAMLPGNANQTNVNVKPIMPLNVLNNNSIRPINTFNPNTGFRPSMQPMMPTNINNNVNMIRPSVPFMNFPNPMMQPNLRMPNMMMPGQFAMPNMNVSNNIANPLLQINSFLNQNKQLANTPQFQMMLQNMNRIASQANANNNISSFINKVNVFQKPSTIVKADDKKEGIYFYYLR
jgi:hypothetical protein